MMPECSRCKKERSSLKRMNPLGEKGVFVCLVCLGEAEEPTKGEEMTCLRQLERWVKGESVHNKTRDECCPDFSCCEGNGWTLERRQEFAKAFIDEDHVKTQMMLIGAFSDIVEDLPKKVHIAGMEPL